MSRRTGIGLALVVAVLAAAALAAAIPRPAVAPPVTLPSPSPSASPPPSAAVTASPVATAPPATATPTADTSVVSLLDIRADRVLRLVEVSGYILHADFVRGRREILVGTTSATPPDMSVLYRFDLDGRQIDRGAWPPRGVVGDFARCNAIRSVYDAAGPGGPPPIVEIDGKRFENVNCGAISPDGRWMTYWLWAQGAVQDRFPLHVDQWLIELGTGQRRMLKRDLVHCGGCDSVPGPKWSPSGRYVYFSDVVAGGNRFFLADARSGEVRALADHVPREPFDVPAWSPVGDDLVRSSGGRTVLERLAEGSVRTIGDWPARFDATGRLLYAPAWAHAGAGSPSHTRIYDVATGALLAELAGLPEKRTFLGIGGPPFDPRPVLGTAAGSVATLLGAPGCAGTVIYAARQSCVVGATAPELSGDGSMVALARPTGDVVTTQTCRSCFLVEIVVIDTATGREIAASSSSIRVPVEHEVRRSVQLAWNAEGTHLLVWRAR